MSDSNSTVAGAAGSNAGADSITGAASVTAGAAGADSVPAAATATAPTKPASPVTKVADKVEKPAEAPKPKTPQEIADSRQLANVIELLGQYKDLMSIRVGNAATYQKAATAFGNVFVRILDAPTPATLEVVWSFFVANANTFLREGLALSGAEALAKPVRARVELAYTLFRSATKGVNVSDPTKVNQNTTKTVLKSPRLMAFLTAKAATVVAASKS